MEVVADVGVVLQTAEVGQGLLVAPLVVAGGGPAVEVLGCSAQHDLVVDGAAAARHLAPRHVQGLGILRRGLADKGPIVICALLGGGLIHVVLELSRELVEGIVRPCLQKQHGTVGVFGQAVG